MNECATKYVILFAKYAEICDNGRFKEIYEIILYALKQVERKKTTHKHAT